MIKKGLKVKILVGKDKGKTGEVLEIIRKENLVKVKSINMIKRHTKPTKENNAIKQSTKPSIRDAPFVFFVLFFFFDTETWRCTDAKNNSLVCRDAKSWYI